ncbi:MAG: N-acyl-D-amino-acid deacylase family protein [Planctomycetota bacterium]|jgi:N-acyl-D-amino-acid deacylase
MADRYDLIIRGALVFDGTGEPGRRCDIAVTADRIAALGDFSAAHARDVIDAKGLAAAPGFIDSHSHSDLPALLAPLSESRLHAGVTTEICGNCGYAAGPFGAKGAEQFLEQYEDLSITWRTQGEYFSRLEEAGSSVNRAFLAGHSNIRRAAMGGDFSRPATTEEAAEMRRLLAHELDSGAIGMSSGLIYPPGCFAAKEEIAQLARLLGERGLPYASHIRDEGDALIESLDEALYIATEAPSPLHVSHLKVYRKANWHKIDLLREWWGQRGHSGVRVTADCYPYAASHTTLDTLLPQWAYEGGPSAELKRLESSDQWTAIARELESSSEDGRLWESIVISAAFSERTRPFEGRVLSEVAAEMGLSPPEALREMLIADRCRTMAVFFRMSEPIVLEILSWPDVVVGSDSSVRGADGPTVKGFPHPRSYGTTGRVFSLLVRDRRILEMREAVRRMTSAVADIFDLEGRGRLAEGFAADIVIFDPGEISDMATFSEPTLFTRGVKHVIVNGRPVLTGGVVTGEKPGRVLRHGR